MNERDRFDEQLFELMDAAPPPANAAEVNPWHTPLRRIAWGMALTWFTLNFWYWQYILPTVGVILAYLGFRSLRTSGRAFRAAWVLSVAELLWQAAGLMLEATPLLRNGAAGVALGLAHTVLRIAQMLLLRAGLRGVYAAAEVEPAGDPLRGAVIWQIVCLALALTPLAQSWLVGLPVLIAFFVLCRAMLHLSDGMERAGYCLAPAPVRTSGRACGIAYLAVCAALVVGGSLWASRPPLDAVPLAAAGEQDTRQALQALGLPADVLGDLADEHVRALAGALYVHYGQDVLYFGEEYSVETLYDGANAPETPPRTPERHEGQDTLLCTTYYIELPQYRMAALTRFEWLQGGAYWGDALTVTEDTHNDGCTLVGGALLYERNGTDFTAPMPDLARRSETVANPFFGVSADPRMTGRVSFPLGAARQRGYVLYIMQLEAERGNGGTIVDYYHAPQPVQLPYRTPLEKTSAWNGENNQQHFTNFQTIFGRAWEAAQDG